MRSQHVYRLFCLLLLGALAAGTVHAQTDYRTKSTGKLTVGAGFAGGASVTLEPADGFKVKPLFAWRLTADASYPLNPTVGTMLSMGIDSRGFRTHVHDNSDAFIDTRILYFALSPGFKFSAFTLGLNLGFPLSAANTFPNDVSQDFTDDQMDKVTVLVEPRLGVVIPVMDEDIGWLGITLGAGYTVNEIIEAPQGSEINNHMVSGHLGLTWQFGIEGTGRR